MFKIVKYLKPYTVYVVVVILLLFAQANADLALPDYMSRIVNVGIQQGGVENPVPKVIGDSTLQKALLFVDPSQKETVLGLFTRVDSNSADYQTLLKKYPKSGSETLYLLKSGSSVDIKSQTIQNMFGKALATEAMVQQLMADPSKAAIAAQGMGMDLSKLPPGMDIFSVLKMLPADQQTTIIGGITKKIDALDPLLIDQMGIRAVQDEYKRLGVDLATVQTSYIITTGGLMLLITLASALATILVGFLASQVAAGLARDLRRRVFVKVENFSLAELDRFSTASLITRSTNDITQIQLVTIMMMRMVFYAPIIGVGGVIRAMGKASSMWWIIALAVGVLLVVILAVFSIALPRFKSIQKLVDRLNLVVRENLSGMMVIRAFNMQGHEEVRFDGANKDLTKTMLFVTRVMVVMMPLMMVIMNLVSILILWVGAHEVAKSQIRIGDMMAFMQYSMQIFFAFLMMSMMFIMLPRASVSAERIAEVLATEPEITDKEKPKKFPEKVEGRIRFSNVGFRYPEASEDVLHNIDFEIKPGQTTAIIGTTGSGKSTLISLIPRFYDCTEGSVTIDGIDIRDVAQKDLRNLIGFVPQKSNLFTGTIESNLKYADENASAETLREALEVAQALEFVDSKPEGMDAEISQGGSNVSGGQRQRLAIARALVKKAPIYIFDDSFSALDFKTDTRLRQALKKKMSGSTVIMVTQRVATVKSADQILVLDEGKIVGLGTHKELMETCEVYRDIALSQLKQEELA
jgi:ATP-binding cassette subfamily B protein